MKGHYLEVITQLHPELRTDVIIVNLNAIIAIERKSWNHDITTVQFSGGRVFDITEQERNNLLYALRVYDMLVDGS